LDRTEGAFLAAFSAAFGFVIRAPSSTFRKEGCRAAAATAAAVAAAASGGGGAADAKGVARFEALRPGSTPFLDGGEEDDPAPPAATPRRRDFPPVEPFHRRTSPSEPIMESEEDAEPRSSF
jgi:hypothetical protein